jgi:hypothetical protein
MNLLLTLIDQLMPSTLVNWDNVLYAMPHTGEAGFGTLIRFNTAIANEVTWIHVKESIQEIMDLLEGQDEDEDE